MRNVLHATFAQHPHPHERHCTAAWLQLEVYDQTSVCKLQQLLCIIIAMKMHVKLTRLVNDIVVLSVADRIRLRWICLIPIQQITPNIKGWSIHCWTPVMCVLSRCLAFCCPRWPSKDIHVVDTVQVVFFMGGATAHGAWATQTNKPRRVALFNYLSKEIHYFTRPVAAL